MVEVGAIRRSFSPWASAVVLVRKKDGGLRFCIDLCKLNNRTVKEGYSLPRIEDTLGYLWCSVVFHTGPEIWVLAGGVRGRSQASNCIYHGSTWLLGVKAHALWAHQCSSNLSKVDGVLPWWVAPKSVHNLSRWYYCIQPDTQGESSQAKDCLQ